MKKTVFGKVHSIQSLGTLDGPGVRFVVFMQGCNLRCGCCHNPDTQSTSGGVLYTPAEILEKVTRYREYFGNDGGITLSGGEPLLQAEFAKELFTLCKKENINTCLDTSGSILTNAVRELLLVTDRVLLDIKYTKDGLYRRHVGCSIDPVLTFLDYLNEKEIKTTLRQVIIPTLNDNEGNIHKLKEIADANACVDKIELLPFKKICQTKYDSLGIEFPFANLPTPTKEKMEKLNEILCRQE
ncbi:MAG: pyruvate formate lyase-activating protein [Ruminococcaceae bacterium]|nr:pyruvate formate lyase-activating protein [Oscillospiraceae bacterium]